MPPVTEVVSTRLQNSGRWGRITAYVGNARVVHSTADDAAKDGERFLHTQELSYDQPSGTRDGSHNADENFSKGVLCIICPKGCLLTAAHSGCERGADYLLRSKQSKPRVLTTTVSRDSRRFAARSCAPIPVGDHKSVVSALRNGNDELDAGFRYTEIAATND